MLNIIVRITIIVDRVQQIPVNFIIAFQGRHLKSVRTFKRMCNVSLQAFLSSKVEGLKSV